MTNNLPQNQPPQQPLATKKKKKSAGVNLNMGIARAHELATQLIAMQLAAANLLALVISMLSIVAGTITYAAISKPGAWLFWSVAGVVGIILALLIEGMTLGALIRIRLANKQIRTIVLKMEKERDEAVASGKKKEGFFKFGARKRYATRVYRKSRRYSIPLAVVGATASATGGGLFYHQMLSSLGFYESIGISALFALIVTGTFVSSELYKDMQEEAVREGFRGGSLSEEALREETYRQTSQAVATEVGAYLTDQDAKNAIREAAAQLLSDVLSELNTKSADRVGRVTVTPESDTTTRQQPVAFLPQRAKHDTTAATRQLTGPVQSDNPARHDNPAAQRDTLETTRQATDNQARHDSPTGRSDTTGDSQPRHDRADDARRDPASTGKRAGRTARPRSDTIAC